MTTGRVLKFYVCCMCFYYTYCYNIYKDRIPNGDKVPHPCKPNYLWHGVGHENPLGSGVRNQFGKDFHTAGKVWTQELCFKDSDGDGLTNGEELGDPDCEWEENKFPRRTTGITHPGLSCSSDGQCKESFVDCNVEDGLKNCEVLKEPETRNVTIRFPETAVPPVETSYMCMIFDLPSDDEFHLMAYEPEIDNANVMHHILIYGCDPSEPVDASELNKVKSCGMGAGYKCQTLIGLWAVGFTGYCLDGPMGFRFGAKGFKQAAMEFHWNNPELVDNYKDSSGMILYYTPKLRTYHAGILMIGQRHLEIPPGAKQYTVEGTCPSDCSRTIMKGPINIFWATNHMHYLGHEMNVELHRNGKFHLNVTNDEVYSYDSPVEHKYSTAIQANPGDKFVTRCTFKSLSKPKTTFYGDATSDEMCFGFLAYYPADNLYVQNCVGWRNLSLCDMYVTNEFQGCKFKEFLNTSNTNTRSVLNLVKAHCKPFGNCLKECKPVLDGLIKDHPCFSGDVYEYIIENALDESNLELLELIASVNSCKVEMSNEEITGGDDDTSKSARLVSYYSFMFFTIIVVHVIKLNF